ncbi:MAG: AAA family ATPase [Patescibacteria group bacterium]|nr:AAA family ATPase [Patescibacteria group bacterium]
MNLEQDPNINEFKAPMAPEVIQRKPIEISSDKVSILGIEIPRNPDPEHGSLEELRIPEAKQFENVVIDEHFLHLLQLIARGIVLNQPTLIEGEAALGKSFAIEYLAYLTNTPVYRMSLNGQTDTTDLIGKWIPNTQEDRIKLDLLFSDPSRCKSEESRQIINLVQIQSAEQKGISEIAPEQYKAKTGLSREDFMRIAELEGLNISGSEWIWQDGELPREVENGAWTVLDEANTCEPQILVRLNSILERGGKLVLQENGGKVVKPKDPNKTHRTFLTCNPPGGKYHGRVPFSAEFISRFNYQSVGDLPLETAIIRNQKRAGVKNIIFQPELIHFAEPSPLIDISIAELFGEDWTAELFKLYTEARYKLKEMLAGEIGMNQYQKFDYDQRDDIRFQEYLEKFAEPGNMKKVIEEAVEFCLLGKITDPQERQKARDLVIGLIRINEPEVRGEFASDAENRRLHTITSNLFGIGLPDDLLEIIVSR